MSAALRSQVREVPHYDVVIAPPGIDQAAKAVEVYRRMRGHNKELHAITNFSVLKNRIRAMMPFESRGDAVKTYYTYVGDMWRTALSTKMPQTCDYDIDFWEFRQRLQARHVRPLDRRHVIVVQGQQLAPDFYRLLRLLSVGATVFVDPVQTVDDSGTTLDDLRALLGVRTPTTLDDVDSGIAPVHALLQHLGEKPSNSSVPHHENPRPVLVDHENIYEEIRFVVEKAAACCGKQIGVLLPTRELVEVFKDAIGDLFDGRTQWHLSGVRVPKHAVICTSDPGIKVLTWTSAIGMRFDQVVMAGLDQVEDSFRFETDLRVLGPTTRGELFLSYSGVGRPTALSGLPAVLIEDRTHRQIGDEWVEVEPLGALPTPPSPVVVQVTEPSRAAVDRARDLLCASERNGPRQRCLLAAEQEVGLAQLMRSADGDLSEELPRGFRSKLYADDERAQAFDIMVLYNTGLVKSWVPRYAGGGLDDEDLYQHGVLGLMRAIEKWDGSRGLKFSTYAVHWISQHMSRAVADEGTLIRLPVHKYEEVRKVRAVRDKLRLEQEDVSISEIARHADLSPQKVVECLRLSRGVISLDAPLGRDGEISFAELVPVPPEHDSNPDYVVDRILGAELVRRAVSMLKEREAEVIRLRFGFDGGGDQTLEKIGEHFSVTRERIRQIEGKAKGNLVEKLAAVGILANGAEPVPTPVHTGLSTRRALVTDQRRPLGAEIATGSGLAVQLGVAGEDGAIGHLLIALVDCAVESGAGRIRIRTAGAGTSASLTLVHDGTAFAGQALLATLCERRKVSRGSAALGIAASLYDEVTTWDAHTSSACLVLTSAADTDTWWLRRASRKLPAKPPLEAASDRVSVVLFRAPRIQVARARISTMLDHCSRNLGIVFGVLLDRGVEIDVDGRAVTALDPFLWSNPAGQHLGEERVAAEGLSAIVSPRVLPHPDALRAGDLASAGDPVGWQATQGFYVRCGGRHLTCGGWLGLGDLDMAAGTALARVLVDVPSEQRAAWGEDHPGAQVVPPEPLRARLTALARIARVRSELVVERHRTGGTT